MRFHAARAADGAPVPEVGAGTGTLRLRLGVLLVVLSWLPFAQVVIWVAGLSGERAGEVRLAIWTVQVLVGFVGLAVAGSAAARVVRTVGWRHTPAALWRMLRSGRVPG